ncbi:hypothetical protein [Halosolutus halophilus]|uniref:hypothetical protein n=1 Tax=Halosolutus halophilus TaxID=1552990 RepID=UPI0022352D3F|nr:hypothetical protein [Halosolutus halophilus]
MDTDGLLELAGHYLVVLILVMVTLTLLDVVVADPSFWIELGLVVVVAFAYRPIVLRLGVAPDRWERQQRQ